jgi:hypothetical protein
MTHIPAAFVQLFTCFRTGLRLCFVSTRIPAVFLLLFSGSLCPIVLQILKQTLMLIARIPAASFLFLKTYSGSLYAAFSCFRATSFKFFRVFWQPFFSFIPIPASRFIFSGYVFCTHSSGL